MVASCVFDCDTAAQVKDIKLTDIDAPVAGKAPDYTFTGGAGYENNGRNDAYYKNGMCWSEVNSSYVLSDGTQAFLPGKANQADIRIKAKEGYEFATDSYGNVSMTATVNGKSAEISYRDSEEVTLCYTFPKTEEHKCSPLKADEVKATFREAGKKAYYFCPECGKNFEDSKCTKEIPDVNA